MDSRLIKSYTPYQLDVINHLIPVEFESKTDKKGLGIIAQELQKIEPLLVKKTIQGWYEVDYEKLSVVLISTIKSMEERISILENNLKPSKPKK